MSTARAAEARSDSDASLGATASTVAVDRGVELQKMHKKKKSMRQLEGKLRVRRRSVRGEDIVAAGAGNAKGRGKRGRKGSGNSLTGIADDSDLSSEDSEASDDDDDGGGSGDGGDGGGGGSKTGRSKRRRERALKRGDTEITLVDDDWDDDELMEDDDIMEEKDPDAFDIEAYVDATCFPINVDKRNPVRYATLQLVENKWFTRFIIACIIVSCENRDLDSLKELDTDLLLLC